MTTNATADRGIVIIGAGLAGANVISSLREGGYRGPLTLIGNEGHLPYERPPLSKDVLAGAKSADSVYVHDDAWYADHDVTLFLNDAARRIDRGRREVTLKSGRVVAYADLVLATGASPRTPPIPGVHLGGVQVLRTIGDSRTLHDAFAAAKNLVVIGAGWVGLEVAAAARGAGLNVAVLEYAPVPLQSSMGARLGQHFVDLHRRHQVDLRTGIGVEAIEGTAGRVTGVRAGGETYPADLVLIGVGASPNALLAEEAGLEVDNGIVVDEHLRSSDRRILAVGDVANAYNAGLGARLRVEHWDNAIRQGKLAGNMLLGGPECYDWQPYFYSDQFDLGMEYVGRAEPDDEVVIRGDQASGEFIAFWLREGVLTAAMNVNVWEVSDQLRSVLGHRVDTAQLADPLVPIVELAGQG